ncbi:uncharacterized protein LOC143247387 [Tachypleus tridentatus]|uniref:uncharacterized protein LOC143247387 n=1 Tax=Tachypleus tridentatus TaxID=6853 RepID=UPI003FD31B89
MWKSFVAIVVISVALKKRGLIWAGTGNTPWKNAVLDLVGEPSYRSVKLKWRFFDLPEPREFKVHLCEVSEWYSQHRCSERRLSLMDTNYRPYSNDVITSHQRGGYEALIDGLRMSTNYSLFVKPTMDDIPESPELENINPGKLTVPQKIFITTKGFSARASRCLPNISEVIVNTGPYFGGKIVAENAFDERCAVYGNRSSPQETYKIKIVHNICGSKLVNNSRIDTMIVVHENRDIVTHNSRRYLVQCNFVPEAFTIRASMKVPKPNKNDLDMEPVKQVLSDTDRNDIFTYDHYKENNVRDSRILAQQSSAVDKTVRNTDPHVIGQLALMVILVVAAVVGCATAIWWLVSGSKKRAASDISAAPAAGTYVSYTPNKDGFIKEEFSHDDFNKSFPKFYPMPVALMSVKPLPEMCSSKLELKKLQNI